MTTMRSCGSCRCRRSRWARRVIRAGGRGGGVRPVPLPQIQVVKTVDPDVRAVPGGPFTFTVRVSNPGPERIRILTLNDNVYGNIDNATRPRRTGRACVA